MMKVVFVGLGGFLGSVARYLVSGWVYRLFGKPGFPYGTLAVNVLGCLLIGFLSGVAESRQMFSPEARLFVFLGFLGGFTTFSTFGYEVFIFSHDGQIFASLTNVFLHLILGVGAVWVGYLLSRLF